MKVLEKAEKPGPVEDMPIRAFLAGRPEPVIALLVLLDEEVSHARHTRTIAVRHR